jgi:hypothetical protein
MSDYFFRRYTGCIRYLSFNTRLTVYRPSLPALLNSGGAGQYLLHPPSLARTQRTRFDNANTVSDLACIILIVRQKFRGFPHYFLVQLMLYAPVDSDGHRLLHTRTGYDAHLTFTGSSFRFSAHSSLNQFKMRFKIYFEF